MKSLRILSIVIVVLFAEVVVARDVVKLKLPDDIHEKATCLNPEFLFYRPKGVDASKKAPLLVYLHGLVRRGRNIDSLRIVGKWMLFANVEKQKIVLVIPQCDMDPKGGKKGSGRWNAGDVNLLVEYLKKNHKVDENRIYLAGYSMGAFGTWACAVSYPKTFAAIATVAGGGDPRTAGTIKHLPIWVFHGKKDTRVPHKSSEDMVEALKSAGARNVKFTSYPDQGHGRTFGLALNDPELYKWFVSHSRRKVSKTTSAKTTFQAASGRGVRYWILSPAEVGADRKYPLVVTLHGIAGRGARNWERNCHANSVLAKPAMRKEYPCFVVAPTIDKPNFWTAGPLADVFDLIEHLKKELPVDSGRIYVTGQSMGGYGTFEAIVQRPDLFAAAAPVCGGNKPVNAKRIAHIPIWVFHGAKDRVVPVARSREMVEAIRKAGGKPQYTEFPNVRHAAWPPAYNNEDLWRWMFKQNKNPARPIREPKAKTRPRANTTSRPKRTDEERTQSRLGLAKNSVEVRECP